MKIIGGTEGTKLGEEWWKGLEKLDMI